MKKTIIGTVVAVGVFSATCVNAANPETITHTVVMTDAIDLTWQDGPATSAGIKNSDELWGKLLINIKKDTSTGSYHVGSPSEIAGDTTKSFDLTLTNKDGDTVEFILGGTAGDSGCFKDDKGQLDGTKLGSTTCQFLNGYAKGNGQDVKPGVYTGSVLIAKTSD